MATGHSELTFLPYIALRNVDEISFGKARVWNFSRQPARIADKAVQARVSLLLSMYRETSGDPARSRPLRDIGIVSIGDAIGEPLGERAFREVQLLRYALFLCCLADDMKNLGPNAGHDLRTADNFDVITQSFTLQGNHVTEQSGMIVVRHMMGYKIGVARFVAPSHVSQPLTFRCDYVLLREFAALRRTAPGLFRRIVGAIKVFILSYYNAHSLSLEARVLLQVSAFEVLLELPEKAPRRAFKDAIERLLASRHDRKYRYSFEQGATRQLESRTLKGIWADRFYTLRNHLIHGETVRSREYMFRGKQHHLTIGPLVFVAAVKRLIDESRAGRGRPKLFHESLVWRRASSDDDDDVGPTVGFRIDTDFASLLLATPGAWTAPKP